MPRQVTLSSPQLDRFREALDEAGGGLPALPRSRYGRIRAAARRLHAIGTDAVETHGAGLVARQTGLKPADLTAWLADPVWLARGRS